MDTTEDDSTVAVGLPAQIAEPEREQIAVRNPRGRWHRPDTIFDLVICRGRFDGYRTIQEARLDQTRPIDRCPTCWP